MTTALYTPGSLRQKMSASIAETRIRLINITRYPGQLTMEIIIPIVFAAMPMLLGRSMSGADAAANFEGNTGTTNYVAYLLIGSAVFMIVSSAFWHIANWIRFEQETGTLEAVYVTPTSSAWLVAGVSMYSAVRGVSSAILAFLLGCLIFRVNPFTGDVFLAMLFIFVGLIPLYGFAFLFGAVVLKVKESGSLLQLMQWVVSFLMGVFYPVTVLPAFLRFVAQLFPPTWMVNGVRSSLLGVGYFLDTWYLDFAVLWLFMLVGPLLGVWVFRRTEGNLRGNEGIGQF